MREIITFTLLIVMIIINARYDANLWLIGIHINHYKRAIVRGVIIACLTYFVTGFFIPLFISWFIVLTSTFWLTFDIAINIYKGDKGNDIFQIGKFVWTDKFLRYITSWNKEENDQYYYALFFKILLFGLSFFVYLLLIDYYIL